MRKSIGLGGTAENEEDAALQFRPHHQVPQMSSVPWLAVIGIGEDGMAGLNDSARRWIDRAVLVVGGRRHLALVGALARALPWPSPMEQAFPEILAQRGRPVVVLASGDPFFFGVGSKLAERVAMPEIVCLPAASTFSLACARLGWAQQAVTTLSFCGRPLEAVRPLLQPGRRLLALSEGPETPAQLAAYLCSLGFGASVMHLMQALGGPREQMMRVTAELFAETRVDPLNIVALELEATVDAPVIKLTPGLADDFFEHDGQITKHEIRALTLSALAPRAGEHLWDIGCGAGSVAIEWLLRHPANTASGLERVADRADRAMRNAARLGVPRLRVTVGSAPEGLDQLARPDAVFIGGGASAPVVQAAWDALSPGGRLVINAVTLETTRLLYDLPARLGGGLTRVSVERLDNVGPRQAFRPAMAVTQFAAVKP